MESYEVLQNRLKSFSMFVRSAPNDTTSPEIAENIKLTNSKLKKHLEYQESNGDLIIAIGGDGTFIDAVTNSNFDKSKLYLGINTGTLGFFQNFTPNEISYLISYLIYVKTLDVRKIYIPQVIITMENGENCETHFLNEITIGAKNYNKVSLEMYINGHLFTSLLQSFTGNGVNIANGAAGDTALSMSLGGPINFTDYPMLIAVPLTQIRNSVYSNDFVSNPILATSFEIRPIKFKENLEICCDGRVKDLPTEKIAKILVNISEESYILKFEARDYSKIKTFREKILGK